MVSNGHGRPLNGMEEIARYASRGEATILKWVASEDFPARKVGGVWISHTTQVDAWYVAKVQGSPPLHGRPAVDIAHLTEVIRTRSRLGKEAAARLAEDIVGEIGS